MKKRQNNEKTLKKWKQEETKGKTVEQKEKTVKQLEKGGKRGRWKKGGKKG